MTGADFDSTSNRLFCTLGTGELVELDSTTGSTLQSWRITEDELLDVDAAPTLGVAALLSRYQECVVIDLPTGNVRWSVALKARAAAPQLSPDGRLVLTSSPNRDYCVSIYSAASGEPAGELTGAKGEILGISISRQGIVYAWDVSGTMTVWDLATRTLLHQFRPEC